MCDFSIDFTGTPQDLISKAETAIGDAGGAFTGDETAGSFTVPTPLGQIKGAYTINASTITISISKKPLLVSCAAIESKLREFLS
jgi:hypothetical protein